MMDKKVTRKEFLLSILSIGALFALSKIPKGVMNKLPLEKLDNNQNTNRNSAYGKHIYGIKNTA